MSVCRIGWALVVVTLILGGLARADERVAVVTTEDGRVFRLREPSFDTTRDQVPRDTPKNTLVAMIGEVRAYLDLSRIAALDLDWSERGGSGTIEDLAGGLHELTWVSTSTRIVGRPKFGPLLQVPIEQVAQVRFEAARLGAGEVGPEAVRDLRDLIAAVRAEQDPAALREGLTLVGRALEAFEEALAGRANAGSGAGHVGTRLEREARRDAWRALRGMGAIATNSLHTADEGDAVWAVRALDRELAELVAVLDRLSAARVRGEPGSLLGDAAADEAFRCTVQLLGTVLGRDQADDRRVSPRLALRVVQEHVSQLQDLLWAAAAGEGDRSRAAGEPAAADESQGASSAPRDRSTPGVTSTPGGGAIEEDAEAGEGEAGQGE